MSSAARRAARLADHVTRQVGVSVDVEWLEISGKAFYLATWRDGPAVEHVRDMLVRRARTSPDRVQCARELGPVTSATALLLFLAEDPQRMAHVSAASLAMARDLVPYPERAPRMIVDLARGVLALCPGGTIGDDALRLLGQHARGGWDELVTWLREGAARRTEVVDLATERRRRRRT